MIGLRQRLRFVDNNLWLGGRVRTQAWWDAIRAHCGPAGDSNRYTDVTTFCTFIGYPRSGHSIVGSILDAHRSAVFSHRLDALRYLAVGYSPPTVYRMIEENSRRFASAGRKLTTYAYPITGQHQGRCDRPVVIGDQEAKWATLRLDRDLELLHRAITGAAPAQAFIHVVRNPFDNIATWANRMQRSLETAAERYFALGEAVERIRAHYPGSVLDIHHEHLVARPCDEIERLCGFLGLPVDGDYVAACAASVASSPHRSRHSRVWPMALVRDIERRSHGYGHLAGYSFGH